MRLLGFFCTHPKRCDERIECVGNIPYGRPAAVTLSICMACGRTRTLVFSLKDRP